MLVGFKEPDWMWPWSQRATAESRRSFLAILVGGIAVIDLIWSHAIGLHIAGLLLSTFKVACVVVIAGAYLTFRPNDRLAEMATYVVLWLVFSIAAAVLTYDSASMALPLEDATFRTIDQALHFDLAGLAKVIRSHKILLFWLQVDYGSLIVQVSLTVLWLAHTRTVVRNAEFLCGAILSLLFCCAIAGLLPALGPTQLQNPMLGAPPDYVGDILAMRSGEPVTRNIGALQGIICFPSFHTVLALLLIWAHRGLSTFTFVAVVNSLMLLSVPPIGNHYLIDMLGGVAVAIISIMAAQALLFPRAPEGIKFPTVPAVATDQSGDSSL